MRSLWLSDRPTLEQLLEVQEHFGLPGPALVEKRLVRHERWRRLPPSTPATSRLVFGGGTALSRAYGLTRRMSEDVDLKIVREKAPSRGELRKLRADITDALLAAGFVFDPENEAHRKTMYEGRYTKYQQPYQADRRRQGNSLGPMSRSRPRSGRCVREAVEKSVISFVAEAYGRSRRSRRSPVPPFWKRPPKNLSR